MADTINQEVKPEPVVQPEQPASAKTDKKDKKKKEKKDKKPRRPFKLVMKTWAKGLGKEASRVSWEKKGNVLKDFITIIIICAFFALIFFGIDMIIISVRR